MEQLPKIVGQRLQAVGRTEAHPDANLLTAFVEKSLLLREQTQILDHLAGCAACREVVAHAQPEEILQCVAVAAAAPMSARRASWLQGAAVRWAALAACVVIVGAVVISRTQFERTPVQKVAVQIEPAVVAKTETQPAPSAPPARESDKQTESDGRLKTTMTAGARRDADELSKLDKQGPALTYGTFDEKRKTDTPTVDLETKNHPPPPPPPPAADTVAASRGVAASAAMPKQQEEVKATKKEFSADKAMKVPSVSETVQVSSEAVQVQAEATPDSSVAANQSSKSAGGGIGAFSRAKDGYAPTAEVAGALSSLQKFPVPQWQLSAKGRLLRSNDSGKSWKTEKLGGKVGFRALCVTDREVWVGGAQGNLFYSANAGENWEQVKPSANGQNLTADVLTIEFKDPQHGKLTTSDHQTWTTTDGGHAWQVETR